MLVKEEEGGGRRYKGSSRRLPLGDGSQMSDPGPLQLIVKQKLYLLFLSVFYVILFALLFLFPLCSLSPYTIITALCDSLFLCLCLLSLLRVARNNPCCLQMCKYHLAVQGRPQMTTANKEIPHSLQVCMFYKVFGRFNAKRSTEYRQLKRNMKQQYLL